MTFTVKPAQPINNRLLIAIAGPQASGKTTSALRLATGITRKTGGKICLIDTENKRALRYAGNFKFDHMEFSAPFNPARYQEALEAAEKAGYGDGDVIIVDSQSHEHDGPGGVLEMHDAILDKMAGNDFKKRDRLTFTAWIKPKAERSRCIQMGLNQRRAHVILCFRAKEKTLMKKNDQGKVEPINDGFQPIGGDEYFFEMDITFILPQGAFGKPDWSEKAARINEYGDGPLKKLLYNADRLSEEIGEAMASWASSQASSTSAQPKTETPPHVALAHNLITEMKRIDDPALLQDFMAEQGTADDLNAIRTASEATATHVENFYKSRMNELQGALL